MGEQTYRIRFERCLFACTIVVALILLWTIAHPVRTGHVPVQLDLGHFHLPLRAWYAECLAQGRSFDWLPGWHNGVFITGEGEHGPYHPLHLFLYRFVPLDRAFALEVFLPFPVMLLGMFLFLRRLTGSAAAMLGSLLYTFSANNFQQSSQVNYLSILAHMPWLLWLIDGATAGATPTRRRLSLVGIALLTGSQLLLGQPQAMSYSLLAEILYCCFLVEPLRRPLRVGLPLVSAKLLGGLIGAVQLLATWEFLGHSSRSSVDPYAGSLPFSLLVQLLSPGLMRLPLEDGWFPGAFYVGMVPILLALYWLGVRKMPSLSSNFPNGDREALPPARLLGFADVLGILAVWLATGSHGGLYALQLKLPFVKYFRAPGRYINLLGFAAAVLSALVFQQLQQRVRTGPPLPWRRLVLPWLGVAATLAVALAFHFSYPHLEQRHLSSSFYSGPLMAAGAAVALTLAARARAVGLFALMALSVVEIDYFCLRGPNVGEPLWRYTPTMAEWVTRVSPPPTCGSGRVLVLLLSLSKPSLCLMQQGERLVNGYQGGLEPRKVLDYMGVRALRLSGAGWYIDSHHFRTRGRDMTPADEDWHAIPSPLPRVRLLDRAQVSANPAADLEQIDIETTAMVSHPISIEPGERGLANLIHEEPGELRLHVETPGRRLLVIADSYDPAWQVEVDGEPRCVERVNGDFLGCVMESGAHDVRFLFRPASIYYGRRLSLFGIILALLIAGATLAASWLERRKMPRNVSLTKDMSSPLAA
jgi:hypothetical protein